MLPRPSFLPILMLLLGVHREIFDWSSFNRRFRLYMRCQVHKIGCLGSVNTKQGEDENDFVLFRCRFVIQCYPDYMLKLSIMTKLRLYFG